MKKLNLVICFLIIGRITFSQDVSLIPKETDVSDKNRHAIHTDLGTIAFVGFYSINYEVTLKQKADKNILRFRTGFLYTFDTNSYGVPLCLTALFGKNNKYFELNLGGAPRILSDYMEEGFTLNKYLYYQYSIYPIIELGYRYEPVGKLSRRFIIGSTGLSIGFGYTF